MVWRPELQGTIVGREENDQLPFLLGVKFALK